MDRALMIYVRGDKIPSAAQEVARLLYAALRDPKLIYTIPFEGAVHTWGEILLSDFLVMHEDMLRMKRLLELKKRSRLPRRPISPKLRFFILKRDNFRCVYCGDRPLKKDLHIDHKRSVKDGGTDSPDNLATACLECNIGKGSKSL